MIKKIIYLLMTLVLFVGCIQTDDEEKIVDIKLTVEKVEIVNEQTNISLKEKETVQLYATALYSNGEEGHRGFDWQSSDLEIAIVDEDGLVTAKKSGETATITASRGEAIASIEINVKETEYQVIGALNSDMDWSEINVNNNMTANEDNTIFTKEVVIDDIPEGTSELRKFKFSKDGIVGNHFKPLFESEMDFLTGITAIEGTIEESLSTCKINYVNGTYLITLDVSDVENIVWKIEKTSSDTTKIITYQVIGALDSTMDWSETNVNNNMAVNEDNTIFTKEVVIDDIPEGTSELRKFKFSKDGIVGNHFKPLFEGEMDLLSGITKIEGTIEESLSTCKINYINGTYLITLDISDVENIVWKIEKTN